MSLMTMSGIRHTRAVFVDRFTAASLGRCLAFGASVEAVWSFDPPSRRMCRLIAVLRRLGVLRVRIEHIRHHVGHLRDEDGASQTVAIVQEARAHSTDIRNREIACDPLIRALGSWWSLPKLVFYFERLTETELAAAYLQISLAQWMARTQLGLKPDEWVLLLMRGAWFTFVERYARSRDVRIAGYGRGGMLGAGTQPCIRGALICLRTMRRLLRGLWWRRGRLAPRGVAGLESPGRQPAARIAIRYWYRSLSLNPGERSEFFWLKDSGIPPSEVLLYDYVPEPPLASETYRQLQKQGITLMGVGPGVTAWSPTWHCYVTFCRAILRILRALGACAAGGQRIRRRLIGPLIWLAAEYSYWHDFFSANRVRVNVCPVVNTSIAQTLAIEALGGVSTSYQYSISNLLFTKKALSAGEHVRFVFSPSSERLWRSLGAPIEYVVPIGYVYDGAFETIRAQRHAARIRARLQARGAGFIACFFDENSVNRWDIKVSDDVTCADYEYVLRWLLSDPTLGLICKPKRSDTLFQRLARLKDLIAQARQTGRCVFLTSEARIGPMFPAEIAMAADICIGKLEGASAALEAALIGVPTVLVDREGLRSHPFHGWGKGRVVFDDWPMLRNVVEQLRAAPTAHPEFGDWTDGLDDLDPYRDGRATRRLGCYIGWVYEALKAGASRPAALADASARFMREWKGALHRHTSMERSVCH